MDLARSVYSRDLKIAAMRALDAGSTAGEIARKYHCAKTYAAMTDAKGSRMTK
jgi:hypothetical protein